MKMKQEYKPILLLHRKELAKYMEGADELTDYELEYIAETVGEYIVLNGQLEDMIQDAIWYFLDKKEKNELPEYVREFK